MAAVELILLQRVEKLGQMGERGEGEARLRPQLPAAAEEGDPRQQGQPRALRDRSAPSSRRRTSSAARRPSASPSASAACRSSSSARPAKSGSLYGSVSGRDIADAATDAGLTINRQQVVLEHPIKTLGLTKVRVVLHPEVSIPVTVNVARSPEEAEKQARGERIGAQDEDEDDAAEPRARCSSPAPMSDDSTA